MLYFTVDDLIRYKPCSDGRERLEKHLGWWTWLRFATRKKKIPLRDLLVQTGTRLLLRQDRDWLFRKILAEQSDETLAQMVNSVYEYSQPHLENSKQWFKPYGFIDLLHRAHNHNLRCFNRPSSVELICYIYDYVLRACETKNEYQPEFKSFIFGLLDRVLESIKLGESNAV